MMEVRLKISIITATFNADKHFEKLIESIRNQKFTDFEWIVVDGQSSDNTINLINNNRDIISHFICESDSGIYDAWNKGLEICSGEYVCFIGADDVWHDNLSLKAIFEFTEMKYDFVSARVAVVEPYGRVVRSFGTMWSIESMLKMNVVAHPGMLVKRQLFAEYGKFNIKYKIVGDYEWLLRLDNNLKYNYLNKVIVKMGAGGVSQKRLLPVLFELYSARKNYVNQNWFSQILFCVKYFFILLLSRLILYAKTLTN